MKRKLFILLIAALFVLAAFAGCAPVEETPAVPAETAEPTPMPSDKVEPIVFTYESTDINGETVSVADLCAEYDLTLVNFWATWCGPCVSEMPHLASLYEEQKENGIGVIGIWLDPENAEDCEAILAGAGTTYPVLKFDAAMAEHIDLSAIPVSIFLDKDGNMVGDSVLGARDERKWISEIADRLSMLETAE